MIRYASPNEIANETPCGTSSPRMDSKMSATAGSPRKPMPSEVKVMPSWQAAR